MSDKNLRLRAYVCGVLATAAISGANAADEKGTEKAAILEEIVVTAERREQSLQEVPLSISAFSDQQREVAGILSIQDMANFAPGVSYNTSTDRPSIRGIARQSNFFTLDSPVANYFDGVYTSSVQDAQRRPLFIERTEILRGPQGALSGRGSIAGAINTISKRPRDTFGGEVRVFGGNYKRYGAEGTVTGPLADWMRVRVNLGHYAQNEGYFENVATGQTEGDQPNNRTIQDYLFEFNLGQHVDWFLKAAFADYDESRRTGYTTAPITAGAINAPGAYGLGTSALVPLASYGYFQSSAVRLGTNRENPVLETGDVHKFSNNFLSNQRLDGHHNYTSNLTWRAPFADVKWIAGHQAYRYTQLTDVDGTDVVSITLPSVSPTIPGRVVNPSGTNLYMEFRRWYSNELTFTSTSDGPFSWIGGLYQSDEKFNQEPATTTFTGYPELNDPIRFAPGAVFVQRNPAPFTSVRGLIDGKTVSSAAFGQMDYKFGDHWKVTVGARYNKDEKEATESLRYIANALGASTGTILAGGFLNGPAGFRPYALDVTPVPTPGAALPRGVTADYGIDPVTGYRTRDMAYDWSALTGSAGIDYKPTQDDLIYLRWSRGYRPGGFNAGFLYDPPMVDKESVDSYEVGYKTTIAGRLQLSTSVFYYDYKDIQLPLPTLGRCTDPNDLSTCTILDSFVNLPSAVSRGLEVEANWAATDNLNLYLSYGYLDAHIKDAISGNNGYSNPLDPAAILPSAHPYLRMGNNIDTNYTYLPRYTQDLSGNSLANSPKNRVALNANYTFHLDAGNLVLSASGVYRDSQYADVFETDIAKVPGYKTYSARLIWTDVENRYTVMLYGTNLTDELAADGASGTRLSTGLATSTANASAAGALYFKNVNLSPPREFGLELQYRFGGK